jgi:hypothetical protein
MKKRDNSDDIGSAIYRLMRSGKLKQKYYHYLIQNYFEKEFGAFGGDIASIKLFGHTLFIRVESASLRNELSLSKHLLISRINEVLKEKYIEQVEIR